MYIFQAQHFRIKTRLTDWTQSHENALAFALLNDPEKEETSILWVYKCPYDIEHIINFNKHEHKRFLDINPFKIDKTIAVKHYSMFEKKLIYKGEINRFRQFGSFILVNNENLKTPIEKLEPINQHLEKIFINHKLKQEILNNYLNNGLLKYLYDIETETKKNQFDELNKKIKSLNLKYFK